MAIANPTSGPNLQFPSRFCISNPTSGPDWYKTPVSCKLNPQIEAAAGGPSPGENGMMEQCSNCGQELSAANVTLALDEASGLSHEELRFCCPGYDSETDSCGSGYSYEDENEPAWWATI